MKLAILKEIKLKGKLVPKGSIVEIENLDEANSLIASAQAEAPRKSKEAPKAEVKEEAAKDEPKKGKK